MKKLLKNPLFYKEWIVCRWMALIMSCLLIIIKCAPTILLLSSYKKSLVLNSNFVIEPYWFNNQFLESGEAVVSLWVLILILVCLLFRYEKQTITCGLISSMPFKRKNIIISKYIIGLFCIFVAFFINFFIMTIFYILNVEFIKTSYIDIPMWYLINFLHCTLFFTFAVFIQALMGKYIVAAFLTVPLACLPIALVSYLMYVINLISPNISNKIRSGGYLLLSGLDIYSISEAQHKSIGSKLFKCVYSNYIPKIIYIGVLIAVFLALSVYFYEKIDIEKIHYIALFKKFEIILKFLISTSIGMVLSVILSDGSANTLIIILITFVVASILSYLLCNKIIKFANR